MLTLFVDADGCAVKEEAYKVAKRYGLMVYVVANQYINVPLDPSIKMQVVSGDFDAADDWIVDNIEYGDILVTSDILLAERCIKKTARVLGPKGHEWDEENIGLALAQRDLNSHLRDLGAKGTGPSPMKKEDRSRFLSKLDQIIQGIKRNS